MSTFNFTRDSLKKLKENGVPTGKKQMECRDSKEKGLCFIQYPSGQQRYYFIMCFRKQRFKIFIGDSSTFNIQEVRRIANELRAVIYKGENPTAARKKAEMLFSELFGLYYEEKKDKKISAVDDLSKYNLHFAPVLATKQIGAFTNLTIEKYHAKKKDELSPATANRHLALLKAIFSYAVNVLEVLTKSPASGISAYLEPQKKRKFFDREQLNCFLAELKNDANIEAQNIIKFMMLCATRSSATRDLRLENYDAKLGTILISMDKGGQGQYVILSDKAKMIVEYQVAKYGVVGRVFRGIDMKSRMSDPSRIIARVCEKAGLPIVGAHCMRHSYSILALENGVSPYQLMTALNHKCLKSTMVYASISNPKLREINNTVASQLNL